MKYAAALALCLVASPAFADAVTYYGHVGDASVVVEFSEDPVTAGNDLFGRYFYTHQGADIPLHAIAAGRADFGLVEEVPCSEEKNNCPHPRDEPPSAAPLGAKWALDILNGGEQLKGEFSSGGRDRPISLLLSRYRQPMPQLRHAGSEQRREASAPSARCQRIASCGGFWEPPAARRPPPRWS